MVARADSPGLEDAHPRQGASAVRQRRWLRAGWPLSALFLGYPLWWLLGVEEILTIALAVPMALALYRQRRVEVPPGFLLWVLFLVSVTVGVLVLQVDAPGAIAGDSNARYLTWAYRLMWYLACTVVLLYIGNTRREISATRICRLVAWMFVVVTAGGLLGILVPGLDFPSLLETMLPNSIVNQPFIYNLIHPTVAEIQMQLGRPSPRPSAPFTYANIWGLNFAVTLPFFVRAWLGRDAAWRRFLAPLVLVAAAVPVIYSLNRGLWLALIAMALFTAIRSALTGRPTMLISVVAGAVVLAAVVYLSPLGSIVQQRLTSERNSNEGRTNLSSLAVQGVAEKSPIAGFGTTRNVQGNFNTIAGGATALCPRCDPPALGTQGQLWLIVYSQGFVGAALYIAFFLSLFLRNVRSRTPSADVGIGVLLASFVTLPVYNSLGFALFQIMIAAALLWRENSDRDGASGLTPMSSLAEPPPATLRRRGTWVVSGALIGVVAGAAWQAQAGTPAKGKITVLLPREGEAVAEGRGPLTIDTLAQLASSAVVRRALHAESKPGSDTALSVQALPNTTILDLVVTSRSVPEANVAVQAATAAYVQELNRVFADRRSAEARELGLQADGVAPELGRTDATLRRLAAGPQGPATRTRAALLELKQQRLEASLRGARDQLASLRMSPPAEATIIRPVRVAPQRDYWNVALASGLLLGLLAGSVLAMRATGAARAALQPSWPQSRGAASSRSLFRVRVRGG
jgi:hypothetical protein